MQRDFENWRELRAESRAFLKPWEPRWPADDLTRAGFRRRLLRQDRDRLEDQAYAFLLFREEDHALLGGLTLGNVRRGVAQCGTLGYWMGEPFAGQGYMSKGGAGRRCATPSSICGCTGSRPPARRTTTAPAACWSGSAFSTRVLPAPIC